MDENKERQAVEYLKKQIDMGEPNTVLAVYKQVIEQNVFHTQIGYDFLQELKDFLYANPSIPNSSVPEFQTTSPAKPKKPGSQEKKKPQKKPEPKTKSPSSSPKDTAKRPLKKKETNKILLFSLFLNIVFLVMVVIMFVLTLTSDSPNIINYREKIENEYAQWEEDLTNREQELKQREAAIGQDQDQYQYQDEEYGITE